MPDSMKNGDLVEVISAAEAAAIVCANGVENDDAMSNFEMRKFEADENGFTPKRTKKTKKTSKSGDDGDRDIVKTKVCLL